MGKTRNPYHLPGGSSKGGEFTSGPGGANHANREVAKSIEAGTKGSATRMVQGQRDMIDNIARAGGLSKEDAAKAFEGLKQAKALKFDLVHGTYRVKHGAFMDADVLKRAVTFKK